MDIQMLYFIVLCIYHLNCICTVLSKTQTFWMACYFCPFLIYTQIHIHTYPSCLSRQRDVWSADQNVICETIKETDSKRDSETGRERDVLMRLRGTAWLGFEQVNGLKLICERTELSVCKCVYMYVRVLAMKREGQRKPGDVLDLLCMVVCMCRFLEQATITHVQLRSTILSV